MAGIRDKRDKEDDVRIANSILSGTVNRSLEFYDRVEI